MDFLSTEAHMIGAGQNYVKQQTQKTNRERSRSRKKKPNKTIKSFSVAGYGSVICVGRTWAQGNW